MSLGVHFALATSDVERILAFDDGEGLQEFLTEDIEESYLEGDRSWAHETDKAWDAIHRCLTDGRLVYSEGPFPLAFVVLGGRCLAAGEDYTACLVQPEGVKAASEAMGGLTRAWFEQRYATLGSTDYAYPLSEEDFEYTWANFEELRAWFQTVAASGRHVLFTTDC